MSIILSVFLLFLGIGILILIHICIIGAANSRTEDTNNETTTTTTGGETNNSLRSASMSREDLEKLPIYDYVLKNKGSSPVDCAVCLDNFKAGDKCRLLPLCKHSFHAQCVDAWLLKTPICPICRSLADSRRESSSLFGDSSFDMRGSLTTTESSRFSDASFELPVIQATTAPPLTATAEQSNDEQLRSRDTSQDASITVHETYLSISEQCPTVSATAQESNDQQFRRTDTSQEASITAPENYLSMSEQCPTMSPVYPCCLDQRSTNDVRIPIGQSNQVVNSSGTEIVQITETYRALDVNNQMGLASSSPSQADV